MIGRSVQSSEIFGLTDRARLPTRPVRSENVALEPPFPEFTTSDSDTLTRLAEHFRALAEWALALREVDARDG